MWRVIWSGREQSFILDLHNSQLSRFTHKVCLHLFLQNQHLRSPPSQPDLCFLSLQMKHHLLHITGITSAKTFSSGREFSQVMNSNEWILGKLRPHISYLIL